MKKLLTLFVLIALVPTVLAADMFGVYQDTDGDDNLDFLGYVTPFSGQGSAIEAYNFFSWSAHMEDPVPEAFVSKVFLYSAGAENELYLGMFHHKDAANPNAWNKVDWDISFNTKMAVEFEDDNADELFKEDGIIKGRWSYKLNTDGGMAIFHDHETTEIVIDPVRFNSIDNGIKTWGVYTPNGEFVDLMMDREVVIKKTTNDEVPEFGTIGAMLALAGIGYSVRKNRK